MGQGREVGVSVVKAAVAVVWAAWEVQVDCSEAEAGRKVGVD